jgi:hypothetical protein
MNKENIVCMVWCLYTYTYTNTEIYYFRKKILSFVDNMDDLGDIK